MFGLHPWSKFECKASLQRSSSCFGDGHNTCSISRRRSGECEGIQRLGVSRGCFHYLCWGSTPYGQGQPGRASAVARRRQKPDAKSLAELRVPTEVLDKAQMPKPSSTCCLADAPRNWMHWVLKPLRVWRPITILKRSNVLVLWDGIADKFGPVRGYSALGA